MVINNPMESLYIGDTLIYEELSYHKYIDTDHFIRGSYIIGLKHFAKHNEIHLIKYSKQEFIESYYKDEE